MAFWDRWLQPREENVLNEAIGSFRNKGDSALTDKQAQATRGEGFSFDELITVQGYGKDTMNTFNNFYNNHIDNHFADQAARLSFYRMMAEMPEIAAVVEDIIIESSQEDDEGSVVTLDITDTELEANENIVQNLQDQFDELFHDKIEINDFIFDMLRSYYVDGKVYVEKIIHKNKSNMGLIGLKKLPAETMDFFTDSKTGRIIGFIQYLNPKSKKFSTWEEAEKEAESDNSFVLFFPEQIIYLDYGVYGRNKKDVIGYLEKAKIPYNQLKLLETSVIIYRIVKSPERLVFKIDTGAMPRDKAMKFVEKIRHRFTQRIGYNQQTGKLENEPEVISMLDNYFLPTSSDGRGSDITSIGGNPAGFAELDDIYYFARKLYMALKYPMSRVMNIQEGRQGDNNWFQGETSQISRDEIRWSKFLERHQNKFEQVFLELYLLHLEFQGLKKEYELDKSKFNVTMVPPNNYKDQMQQLLLETQMNNYNNLANNEEFSRYFLMREMLGWDEEKIVSNSEGFDKDDELFPRERF
jgi:hypothetical protein